MTNVVVMLSDQLRADCLGCYGNRVVKTPHVDQLALNGSCSLRIYKSMVCAAIILNVCRADHHWDHANRERYRENFQAVVSPLPLEAYYDVWAGDRTVEDQALSRFVGFPNPHNPFEPPEPYASMYDPADAHTGDSDLGRKPRSISIGGGTIACPFSRRTDNSLYG